MELPSKTIYSVVLLGTSGVGKSSIAFYLEHGYPPPSSIRPTIAFGISHVVLDGTVISLIDVGGQRKFLDMRYHERFVKNADGLVFVIDSSRRDFKYDEQWLQDALELISENIPILIIANKQDLPNALNPDFFKRHFLLQKLQNRNYFIFGTVAADPGGIRSGENLESAFRCFIEQLAASKQYSISQK